MALGQLPTYPRSYSFLFSNLDTTATVDGDNGLGLVVGPKANRIAMEKVSDVTCQHDIPFLWVGAYDLCPTALGLAQVSCLFVVWTGPEAWLRMGVGVQHKPLRYCWVLLPGGSQAGHDWHLNDKHDQTCRSLFWRRTHAW